MQKVPDGKPRQTRRHNQQHIHKPIRERVHYRFGLPKIGDGSKLGLQTKTRERRQIPRLPFKEKKEHELFKFGPSKVYASEASMKIPIVLGDEIKEMEVSVVNANIPFLLGRDYLRKWDCELAFKDNSMIINKRKRDKSTRSYHPKAIRR